LGRQIGLVDQPGLHGTSSPVRTGCTTVRFIVQQWRRSAKTVILSTSAASVQRLLWKDVLSDNTSDHRLHRRGWQSGHSPPEHRPLYGSGRRAGPPCREGGT